MKTPMDFSTHEHSDSDSGESWTLLENTPTYGDEAPHSAQENDSIVDTRTYIDHHNERDDDTDGISIISDSETESSPCDLNYVSICNEESPVNIQEAPAQAVPPTHIDSQSNIPTAEETDFLGDNVKYKTYVHKRNPKVGSILDIIMLGTFVITAGVALGHLWSSKNECNTPVSVNSILSNLYKLQEENSFLRNKLKELTEISSYQLSQQEKPNNKQPNQQLRCKKIFEEPVFKNNKQDSLIKCVEDNNSQAFQHESIPDYERELLRDIDKMKDIYEENKEWIDRVVRGQFDELSLSDIDVEQNNQKNMEPQLGPIIIPLPSDLPSGEKDKDYEKAKTHKQINLEKQLGSTYYEMPLDAKQNIHQADPSTKSNVVMEVPNENNIELKVKNKSPNPVGDQNISQKKISYADSLKADQPLKRIKRSKNEEPKGKKEHFENKRRKISHTQNFYSNSEETLTKDDRYLPKTKYLKKKHDRQKSQKRHKRNNKYEQWEMKGGYLKDFDEFSLASSASQDNDNLMNKQDRQFLNVDFEHFDNMLKEDQSVKQLPKATKNDKKDSDRFDKGVLKELKGKKNKKDSEWYEQRAALRDKARSKLKQELFGEDTSNTAAWYFRRMQKREQCRTQKDNTTYKTFSKRKMNFKMKR